MCCEHFYFHWLIKIADVAYGKAGLSQAGNPIRDTGDEEQSLMKCQLAV